MRDRNSSRLALWVRWLQRFVVRVGGDHRDRCGWVDRLAFQSGNVLIPALILGVGLIGFGLYRKQRRER